MSNSNSVSIVCLHAAHGRPTRLCVTDQSITGFTSEVIALMCAWRVSSGTHEPLHWGQCRMSPFVSSAVRQRGQ